MEANNQRELFDFDDADDEIMSTFSDPDGDILSTFDDFEDGDQLLKALSDHDDNLFNDIEMENNNSGMNTPPQASQAHAALPNPSLAHAHAALPNQQSFGYSGINRDINSNNLPQAHAALPNHQSFINNSNILPQAQPSPPNNQKFGYSGMNANVNGNINIMSQAHNAAARSNHQHFGNRDNRFNLDNSNNGVEETGSFTVNTFRRRASLNGELGRPNISRRKTKKKSSRNNNTVSAEPLFGGGMRRSSEASMFDDDISESDGASACTAPADLMTLCGLYDDPTNTPDVLDIQNMLLNSNNRVQNLQSRGANNKKGIQDMETMYAGGGIDEETLLIRQRQQQLLEEERKLQGGSGPRRRKSHDGTLPEMDELQMKFIQDRSRSARPSYNGDIPISAKSGTNVQIKRRKSESMMDSLWDELSGGSSNENTSRGMTMNNSSHSLDHLMGFPASSAAVNNNLGTHPNAAHNWGRKSALDVAVEEAQGKINHLKQLLMLSKGMKENGTSGSLVQGEQKPSAKKSWWSSLESELGGTGLNLTQSSLGQSNLGGMDQDFPIPSRRAHKEKKPKSKPKKKPEEPAAPAQIPLPDKLDPEILKLDPTKLMEKLKVSMSRTTSSMKQLQQWDRANGLPKSHSQTMVNSNKSRKQLAKEAGMASLEIQEAEKVDGDETEKSEDETEKIEMEVKKLGADKLSECSDLGK